MPLNGPPEHSDRFTPLGPAIKPTAPTPGPPPPRAPQPGAVPVDMADIGMILRDGVKPNKTAAAGAYLPSGLRTVADLHAQQSADWLKLREWDEAMQDAGWRDMAPKQDKD